jgi:hypothetical protein
MKTDTPAPAKRRVPWPIVGERLRDQIIRPPAYSSHVVLLGKSGSGKDHTVRWGILPWLPLARVVVLVTKMGGEDRTWEGFGNWVDAPGDLPAHLDRGKDGTPRYVLPLQPGRVDRAEVGRLLDQLGDVGQVVVVIGDASRLSTRASDGGLQLERELSNLMSEGREGGVTVIACATSAAWLATGLKDQAAAYMIGQTGGADTLAEFAKMARLPGTARSVTPERAALATLPERWWLYTDHRDGEIWSRVATPPHAGWVSEAWPEQAS